MTYHASIFDESPQSKTYIGICSNAIISFYLNSYNTHLYKIQSTPSNIHPLNINITLLSTVVTERISAYINYPAYINCYIIPADVSLETMTIYIVYYYYLLTPITFCIWLLLLINQYNSFIITQYKTAFT